MEKQLKENIDFFMVTEEAWNDLQKDRFKKISPESFLKEIKSFK